LTTPQSVDIECECGRNLESNCGQVDAAPTTWKHWRQHVRNSSSKPEIYGLGELAAGRKITSTLCLEKKLPW